MVRIIAVSSGKGGVGKTVTVTNLGTVLASIYNKNVIAIDSNLTNPHLGLSLGTFSSWPITLNNVLRNEAQIEQAVYSHSSGLKVIPASFEEKDLRRLKMAGLRSRLKRLFETIDADIVLLDSSPGLTRESLLSLKCSDEVIFVATPHIPSIVDITKCCQLLKNTDAKPIGIILNRVRNKNYEMGEEEIRKFTNLPIIGKVPEDESVLKSTNIKSPVVLSFPNSSASMSFIKLGSILTGQPDMSIERSGLMKRVFGRFFRGI